MAENLRIFGFKDRGVPKPTMLIIMLISDSKEFYSVWPDSVTMKVVPAVTEERVRAEAFIPPADPNNLAVWKPGQVAYLDEGGTVHVGQWEELEEMVGN